MDAHGPGDGSAIYIQRFDRFDRTLHALLMTSFLGLTATGLPLLFADEAWAARLARLFGGFQVAGTLHRMLALLLIGVFFTHVGRILKRVYRAKDLGLLWGPRSLVPQPRDVVEFYRHMRWFVGLGARPRFDRYTYWEKFDYWAVFWGMGIIGGSGLVLWFPEAFAWLFPGWIFNVALLVHGEEALLAVGFIFTIHFFNSHLRPDKFPMDKVIFTGKLTLEELAHERPAEYERLRAEGKLEGMAVKPPSRRALRGARLGGSAAVAIGLTVVVLILKALLD